MKVMRKIIVLLLTTSILWSCSDGDSGETKNVYQQQVVSYFKEVGLGFEFGSSSEITRKWNTDMKLFVGGAGSTELRAELQRIIEELNTLTAEDGFDISITTDTLQCNAYLFLGSGEDFAKRFSAAASGIDSNWGLFYVSFNPTNHLNAAWVYVDIFRASATEQKHLLREELTQSLGLAKDSPRYSDSIFQSSWTTVNDYSAIDRDLIRLLYSPQMTVGLDNTTVEPVLQNLVKTLEVGS
jgi:hypothetical protein